MVNLTGEENYFDGKWLRQQIDMKRYGYINKSERFWLSYSKNRPHR